MHHLLKAGRPAFIEEFFASDWLWHAPPGMPASRAGLQQMAGAFRSTFSDIHCTVDEQIAEGDKVAWQWTFKGTRVGELLGISATGRQVVFNGISIDRLADGRFAERWDSPDMLGLMQQLGAIPAPGPTSAS